MDDSPLVKTGMMNFNQQDIIVMQGSESNPKQGKRADAIANRKLILTTAQQLFAKQGVAKICMATIAEAAAVGKGTLYRSFANKGELCLALMHEDMIVFQNSILTMFREKYNEPALLRLDDFLDQLVHFMNNHAPLMVEVQKQGTLHLAEPHQQSSSQMWLPWLRSTVAILLRQAADNGEIDPPDIAYLVDAILAPLNADLFLYQRQSLGFDLERISQGLRQLILNGCRIRAIKTEVQK